MDIGSLNDLKRKHNAQNLRRIKMKQLLVKFSPVTERFYRKQIESRRMYDFGRRGIFPSRLSAAAIGFHGCASTFMWYHQLLISSLPSPFLWSLNPICACSQNHCNEDQSSVICCFVCCEENNIPVCTLLK